MQDGDLRLLPLFASLVTLVSLSLLIGLELLTRLAERRHPRWMRTGAPARPGGFYREATAEDGELFDARRKRRSYIEELTPLYGDRRRARVDVQKPLLVVVVEKLEPMLRLQLSYLTAKTWQALAHGLGERLVT